MAENKQEESKEQQQQSQQQTLLNRSFTFYFSSKVSHENWKDQVKQIGKFNTVEDFWAYYQHMQRPDTIPEGSQFYLFQNNIQPMWEDEANKNGGKFVLKIKKKFANRIWEDLLLGYIGEQCDEIDNVCGLYLNAKDTSVWINIWIKDLQKNEKKDQSIRAWILQSLELPEGVHLEYRDHPKEGEQQQKPYTQQQKDQHYQKGGYKKNQPKIEKQPSKDQTQDEQQEKQK